MELVKLDQDFLGQLLKNLDFSIGESSLEGQLKKNNLHIIKKENDIDNYDKNTVQPLIDTSKEMIPEMPENNFKTNSSLPGLTSN